MSWTNYHSHCYYCDGKGAPRDYILKAMENNMPAYGISSHAPLPFGPAWCMPMEKSQNYLREIQSLKKEFEGKIEVYTGLEVDYIPQVMGPNNRFIKNLKLDYTIGSVHFVDRFSDETYWEIDGLHKVFLYGLEQIFNGDVQRAVSRYFELTRKMVTENPPDVVGHLDKIKIQNEDGHLFSEEADWYREAMESTLQTIAEKKLVVEVNTRGIYKKKTAETYPSKWVLERMFELGIPVQINADSHHIDEMNEYFTDTAQTLYDIGYRELTVLLHGKWQSVPFDINGI